MKFPFCFRSTLERSRRDAFTAVNLHNEMLAERNKARKERNELRYDIARALDANNSLATELAETTASNKHLSAANEKLTQRLAEFENDHLPDRLPNGRYAKRAR